jgi:hypothetical protein
MMTATLERSRLTSPGEIPRILEDNDAGKSRVVLDPEDVARLHDIADRLGAMAGVLTPIAQ